MRTCNRRHGACRKQGCEQFNTNLLHPPDDTKSDDGFKNIRNGKLKTLKESKAVMTNGLIYIPQNERSLLPVVHVKIRINESSNFVVTQTSSAVQRKYHSFVTEDRERSLKWKIVKYLEFERLRSMKVIWIRFSSVNLDPLYSCSQLPVINQDIPTQSNVDQFSEFSEVYIFQVWTTY